MDSNLESSPIDSNDAKAAFRRSDTANRKYRRRSPVTCSSSSEGSPVHEHSSRPKFSKEDAGKVTEYRTRRDNGRDLERDSDRNHYGRNRDSYRQFDGQSSRSSHGYYRHNDYIKHDKDADEDERKYHKLSSCSGRQSRGSAYSDHVRSRDYSRHLDKYFRDQYGASGYRSKDKDRESSFLQKQKFKDKDSSSERVGSGRRHRNFEEMEGEGNRHALEKDFGNEKKDHRRNSGDCRSGHVASYEEYKGQWSGLNFLEDEGENRLKEGFKSGLMKLDDENRSKAQRKEYVETNKNNRIFREPLQGSADKDVIRSENQESNPKRSTLFSSEWGTDCQKDVSKFTITPDGREPLSSKQFHEGKMIIGKAQANDLEATNDINAAKSAALKAAELVNRNLVGVGGCMTADHKKKLLWGNKKKTAAEEAGHRWETALFSDRERQEKFNKLMSLRLPWCLWPIVGCEGRGQGGPESREGRWERSSSREAEGTSAGFREAVHCGTEKERRAYGWIRSLSIFTFVLYCEDMGILCCTVVQKQVYVSKPVAVSYI